MTILTALPSYTPEQQARIDATMAETAKMIEDATLACLTDIFARRSKREVEAEAQRKDQAA